MAAPTATCPVVTGATDATPAELLAAAAHFFASTEGFTFRRCSRHTHTYPTHTHTHTQQAFVACGGDPEDEESFINKDMLVQLIKADFGLSIDIEAMIEQIDEDGSGKIEFGEFETLLSTVIEMEGGGRRNPPPTPALDSYRQ